MQPHPEGGWYVQTFQRCGGRSTRGHSTAIYYLLERGERSHWHRVRDAAEVWHYYAGAPLALSIAEDGMAAKPSRLGPTSSTANGRRRSFLPTGGNRRPRLAHRRLLAARYRRASIFRHSKWRRRIGNRRRRDPYSAGARLCRRSRKMTSLAARTAPPVTNRQASAMRQDGSAKPKSIRISVDSTGAA